MRSQTKVGTTGSLLTNNKGAAVQIMQPKTSSISSDTSLSVKRTLTKSDARITNFRVLPNMFPRSEIYRSIFN